MRIIILDEHPLEDGRITRHIKFLQNEKFDVIRLHFNLYNPHLKPGFFSQFGERGYRINRPSSRLPIIDSVCYNSILLHHEILYRLARKALKNELNIEESIPVILHVHDPALLRVACKLKQFFFGTAKIVYDRHEVFEQFHDNGKFIPSIERYYEMNTHRDIDGVVSVSEAYQKINGKLFPKTAGISIPNYPFLNDYDQKLIKQKIESFDGNSACNLIYIGSLNCRYDRDMHLLAVIADKVLGTYEFSKFTVGGPAWNCENDLAALFQPLQAKYPERFNYFGPIPYQETVRLLEQSHVGFLLIKPETSYWVKTSPNKVFEYLISGTIPVIRADIEHAEEISNCSLLFSRDSSDISVVERICSLLDAPEQCRSMMKNSLKLSPFFTFESVSKRYIDLYQTIQDT